MEKSHSLRLLEDKTKTKQVKITERKIIAPGKKELPKKKLLFFLLFFAFQGHTCAMEVPRLGVEWELQLPAYATATATQDLSCICDLYHSSWQCQILNPLNEARDSTCISWILVEFLTL